MQLWEPLIFGDLPGPSAGQLVALHLAVFFFLFFFFFSEALLFLRDTALSRFLDSAPGDHQQRGCTRLPGSLPGL